MVVIVATAATLVGVSIVETRSCREGEDIEAVVGNIDDVGKEINATAKATTAAWRTQGSADALVHKAS